MEASHSSTAETWESLALNDEWLLINAHAEDGEPADANYMLMWLPRDLPNDLLRACDKLAATADLIPGIGLEFVQKPSAGFLLRMKPGWSLKERGAAEHAFDKILWELNRIRRG